MLDLIAAVARGDAEPEDVSSAMHELGVDPIEAMFIVVAQAAKAARPVPPSLLDPVIFGARPTSDAVTGGQSKHVVPRVPFVLNGTLYDPPDVARFDGQELHFIPASSGDHLIVIDDRDVIVPWWRLSYLTAVSASADLKTLKAKPSTVSPGGVSPLNLGFPTQPPATGSVPSPPFDSGELPPPTLGSSGSGDPVSYLWEDINQRGESLVLPRNRGYADLTRVGRGFLGLGDWNDEISSVFCVGTTCVLHEHIHFAGSTFTSEAIYNSLVEYGWNDRASSIATW